MPNSDHSDSSNSDSEIWDYYWSGRELKIGRITIKIEKQLTEVFDSRMGQRRVLTLAFYVDSHNHSC